MREKLPLNFGWKFSESFTEDVFKKSFDDSSFTTVDIPHTNKELPYNYFDEKSYQFVCSYRKHFRLSDRAGRGKKRFLLHFEGAANYAVVWFNGSYLGEHKGGYTPFTFDVTDLIARDNVISVKLDCTERSEIPPFGNVVDYLCYGGIYREVWLETVEPVYIRDVFVRTPDVLNLKKRMKIDLEFSEKVSADVRLALKDASGKTVTEKGFRADGRKIAIGWSVSGVKLWDTDDPNLYTLTVNCGGDEKTVRFGFRSCEFRRDGFYLNNRKIKIMGLNRHQSYPYVGYAMPASAQKADAELLKYRLGCNLVRTSHYPDSVHFLDRCDEIGLLVFTEMPSWQYLGEGEWRENCLDNIRAMITRDRNHPSVILWGVRVNEGQDCDEFYTQTNALARSLDDSRQTGGVRNIPRSHLLEDVYTYNDFSHSGGKIALLPSAIVCGTRAPYLVTENNGHMYPTKAFDTEKVRLEHALRHARVQNASHGSKRISGAIGWCMADYNTHKDFGSGDKICYHGVTDMFRVPKLAAAVFSSQQERTPVLETSSSMDIGDHPGGITGLTYIFTNCDEIKVYKNDELKSVIRCGENKRFKNLRHSPVCPLDYIGEALVKEEGMDPVAAKYLKKALLAASEYGFVMPPQHYLEAVFAFLKAGLSFSDMYNIVVKYFAGWGSEQIAYKFEGYKNGELVKTVVRTAVTSTHLLAAADKNELCEDETYDVTRIELLAVDQNGNRLPYANDTVRISVDGPVSVIGPSEFSLIGGDRAFWVRTSGRSGKATVRIVSDTIGEQVIELNVTKV